MKRKKKCDYPHEIRKLSIKYQISCLFGKYLALFAQLVANSYGINLFKNKKTSEDLSYFYRFKNMLIIYFFDKKKLYLLVVIVS